MLSEVGVREKVTLGAFLITLLFILFEYSQGGVATHHLLAREDLPEISNWWGLLTVPLVTWIAFTIVKSREGKFDPESGKAGTWERIAYLRVLYGFIFGSIASILWVYGMDELLSTYILLPFLLSLFFRLYLPEYLVGFVVGMMYSFGGVLPIIVGLFLLFVSLVIHKIVRFIIKLLRRAR